MGMRRRTPRKKINKIIKCGVQVAGALKCKGVTNTAGKIMMLGIMSKFIVEFKLSSFAVSQAVGCARRGGDKISKVRMKRIVGESNKDIWAEARSGATLRIIFKQNGRGVRPEGIKLVHPSRRFGKFVGQNIGNLCAKVFADTLAC